MSFDQNINMITTGNYEEYFVLYMDNELSAAQVKMVEAFLLDHPHLKSELELLMSTKLPVEEISFDKTELLAENMKLAAVDENLLLYIDEELEGESKKKVELELAFNQDYQLQHRVLMQTKLDPSETISYPDKTELYRHTTTVVMFRTWMRIAAAIIVIAAAGILYITSNSTRPGTVHPPEQVAQQNHSPKQLQTPSSNQEPLGPEMPQVQTTPSSELASVETTPKAGKPVPAAHTEQQHVKAGEPVQENLIAFEQSKQEQPQAVAERTNKVRYDSDAFDAKEIVSTNLSKDLINTQGVTSLNPERPVDEPVTNEGSYGNDRKGSVRGFLRRATRLIEKRTGFDPTNENGELLIGAVAINLK